MKFRGILHAMDRHINCATPSNNCKHIHTHTHTKKNAIENMQRLCNITSRPDRINLLHIHTYISNSTSNIQSLWFHICFIFMLSLVRSYIIQAHELLVRESFRLDCSLLSSNVYTERRSIVFLVYDVLWIKHGNAIIRFLVALSSPCRPFGV